MDDNEEQQPGPVWPPAITSPQITEGLKERRDWFSPESMVTLFYGFLSGFAFCLVFGTALFFAFIKLRGTQVLDGVSHSTWLYTFYAGKLVELFSLSSPILLYFWLRRRYLVFATGLLIGGLLVMLFFLRLFFIGI